MTRYAICFDFPEHPDPWFATLLKDGFGLTSYLVEAATYRTQEEAERVLQNAYGEGLRPCGAVVEVEQ